MMMMMMMMARDAKGDPGEKPRERLGGIIF